jgi:hypothetical protein
VLTQEAPPRAVARLHPTVPRDTAAVSTGRDVRDSGKTRSEGLGESLVVPASAVGPAPKRKAREGVYAPSGPACAWNPASQRFAAESLFT